MTTPDERGRRANGLSATTYAALADCDPHVAEALLAALAQAGVAAYAMPHAGNVGGYLELHPPARPLQRVWVDADALPAARRVLAAETAEPAPGDEDAAWQQIVAALRREPDGPAPWPSAEDLPARPRVVHRVEPPPAVAAAPAPPPEDEGHFTPPPPPPLPKVSAAAAYGIAALVGGALVLLVPTMAGDPVGPGLAVLAVVAVVGGFVTLVARMRPGPPEDSGPDDGAVV